uniref:Uncharacterized protein n=1 Tax=Arundo donax TaxID=35708 RepID=A0A0A9DCV5_ARUDO
MGRNNTKSHFDISCSCKGVCMVFLSIWTNRTFALMHNSIQWNLR